MTISLAVVPSLLAVSNVELLNLTNQLKSLVFKAQPNQPSLPVLKCSVNYLIPLLLAITLGFYSVALAVTKSNVVKFLAKPGSVKPHTKFTSTVYVLTKEEGGRHTAFLIELPSTILLPDNRHYRCC